MIGAAAEHRIAGKQHQRATSTRSNVPSDGVATRLCVLADLLRIGQDTEDLQRKRLAEVKQARDDAAVRTALDRVVTDAADPTVNLMPALIGAVDNRVTGGEIVEALEGVFGTYTETAVV